MQLHYCHPGASMISKRQIASKFDVSWKITVRLKQRSFSNRVQSRKPGAGLQPVVPLHPKK
ncbi:hypothetical protein [Bradyrhizobium sp. CCBAU 51765]|uniref:hypothetical protein n=1 Tax=Bradyrhizobium sp. CCBAU 51765 TaxID=1325102 RepID=UPI001889576E|nr:hypothetical protein [Bradyrhizobium sp. CCBAU 51765]